MYWASFLHIYQPPVQERWIVEKVADECYRKLVKILRENPGGRLTLNINGSLTEQFHHYGMNDILDGLRELAEEGRIEFTGSAMYHPVLPLIPEKEVRRQIRLNQEVNRKYLGEAFQPRGFFPPEMCYNRRLAEIVKEEGFSWIIADELSYNGHLARIAPGRTYSVKGLDGFGIFFKERKYSAALTYGKYRNLEEFLADLDPGYHRRETYLLTGTDGEIYGHHPQGLENLLVEAFRHPEIKTCTISELPEYFPAREEVETVAASWSTWEDELEAGIPYPQWDFPGNQLHELQWRLTNLALEAVAEAGEEEPARSQLDRGLHSCQYWWASCRQYFNVEMIEKGAAQLLEAIKSTGNTEKIREAETLAAEIGETARQWRDSGYAERLIREYQRTHEDVAHELTFGGAKTLTL